MFTFLVEVSHEGGGGRQLVLFGKKKDGDFGFNVNAFAEDIDELADGQVARHEVFLLIQVDFFPCADDDGDAVGIFQENIPGLC